MSSGARSGWSPGRVARRLRTGWRIRPQGPGLRVDPTVVPWSAQAGGVTVTWSNGGAPGAWQVRVAIADQPETLFAGGGAGSQRADWIRAGTSYEFRLYRGGDPDETPVARVPVRMARTDRRGRPRAFLSSDPVAVGPAPGRTRLHWDTGDGSIGVIAWARVTRGTWDEVEVARGAGGSVEVGWLQPGSEYHFRLRRAGPGGRPLATTTVGMGSLRRQVWLDLLVVAAGIAAVATVAISLLLAAVLARRVRRRTTGRS